MKWIVFLAVILGGCAKPVSQMNYAEMRNLADQIEARCTAQGAGPGTSEWNNCAKIESNYEVQSRERQQAAIQAAGARMGDALSNAGASASARAAAPPYQPTFQTRQTINCTSSTMAWTTTTSCQ